jgi:hypothetical protein
MPLPLDKKGRALSLTQVSTDKRPAMSLLGHNLVRFGYLKLCCRYFSSFTETGTALVIVSNTGE